MSQNQIAKCDNEPEIPEELLLKLAEHIYPDLKTDTDYYLLDKRDGTGTQLFWLNDAVPEPTEQEISDAKFNAMDTYWWKRLRQVRDKLLVKSDWSTIALFGRKKNAGGRRAQEHRSFVKKSAVSAQASFFSGEKGRWRPPCTGAQDFCQKNVVSGNKNTLFLGEKKTPEAAAHKSTRLLSKHILKNT